MNSYRVRAEREGKCWLLTVPELDIMTQARRLTEADEMVRDSSLPGSISPRTPSPSNST
jgi:hypothetical protein